MDGGASEGGGHDGGGGGGGNAGNNSQCAAGSVVVTDANNSAASAAVLPNATGSFCGTLTSGTDVNYATFTVPATATRLALAAQYTLDGVVIEVDVGGQTSPLGSAPFKPGATYVLKIQTTGDAPVSYGVAITITN
jgi:hypothetical protein